MEGPDPGAVTRYFDAQAAEYQQRSGGGLWSFLRNRERDAILSHLQPQSGERILDAGSGAGYYSEVLLRAGARVSASDLSAPMLKALGERLQIPTYLGDLSTMHFPADFDRVLCAGAFEFVPNPEAALINLVTALRPDGPRVIVLLLPADGWASRLYKRFHRGHGIDVNLFSAARLRNMVSQLPGYHIAKHSTVTFNRVLRIEPTSATT